MSTRWFEIYAPLHEFRWNGDNFELASELWIKRFDQQPNLRGLDVALTQDEQNNIFYAQHWLTFRWNEGSTLSPAEMVNLALLSLWLVKPTKTHVAFRFHLGQEAAAAEKSYSRLLDRFAWVPGTIYDEINIPDLQMASYYYPVLHDRCCARGRLNDALVLTLAGCYSHQWQVVLICHAAAAEALLTYDTGPGVTRRLSKSYACLVETQQAQRDMAFREFSRLYSARSDVMHGRTHKVPSTGRLPTLAQFEGMIRNLWRAVLSSPQVSTALEGTDAQRKAHFLALQSGYTPPSPP